MQSSVMFNSLCGVRVHMMERQPLVVVGRKPMIQIHDSMSSVFIPMVFIDLSAILLC